MDGLYPENAGTIFRVAYRVNVAPALPVFPPSLAVVPRVWMDAQALRLFDYPKVQSSLMTNKTNTCPNIIFSYYVRKNHSPYE